MWTLSLSVACELVLFEGALSHHRVEFNSSSYHTEGKLKLIMAPDDDHLSEVATDCPKLTVEHVVIVDGDEQIEPLETSAGGRMSLRPMTFTIVFSVMVR